MPDFRGQFPLLQRGFAPENADLKIGPLYFKLRQLSAGVLWTDNVHRDNTRRESETNAFMSIGGQLIWQITEGTRIAASGNFVWYPTKDENRISAFAPLSFGLASSPDARVQASWEPVILTIPWTFADEFRVRTGRFTNGAFDGIELFEGFSVGDDEDEQKIFGFRDRSNRSRTSDGYDEFGYFSNEVSASTFAKIPGDLNFRFKASHEDFWYPDNDDSGLPSARNTITARLESYRENLRFKPYVNYRLTERNNPDRLFQVARVGAKGPVTDLIEFDGNVGYLLEDKTDNERVLWHARLSHDINPRTRHFAEWSRNLYDLSDELDQRVIYQFNHVLGPDLTTELHVGYHWVEELSGAVADREDFRAGARATWRVSPRTSIRIYGQYTDVSYGNDALTTETWRERLELSHRFYDRINTRLIYQHTNLESTRGRQSYDENLMYFTMSYVFQ